MDCFGLSFLARLCAMERDWTWTTGVHSGLWSDTLVLVSLLPFSDFYSSNHRSFDFFFFFPGGSRQRRGLFSLI